MKKFLFGCLFLLSACQSATPTPETILSPTVTIAPSPTAIPFTDTPQPTPTPAPSATPFPRFFTDEFDSPRADWSILQAGSEFVPETKTDNSSFVLQMDIPYSWVYAVYGSQEYDNVRVEAQFVHQGGSPASIGLICRYSETDGWFEYNIAADGTYNVLYGQWLAAGIADYLPILDGSTSAIQPIGVSQEIGLVCSGTTLSLLIDQNIIRNVDVSRYELANGKIGFTAASYENTPVIASFNWVRVGEP